MQGENVTLRDRFRAMQAELDALKDARARETVSRVSFLDAAALSRRRETAIAAANEFIYITAYTFDLENVVQWLTDARITKPRLDLSLIHI